MIRALKPDKRTRLKLSCGSHTIMGNKSQLGRICNSVSIVQVQSVSNSIECEVYEGQACKEALLGVQNCLPDRIGSDDVYIPFGVDQEEMENQAALIIERGLDAIGASPECKERAIPFLCIYYFGLCDSGGVQHQPSMEECISVSTGTCQAEWITANLFLPGQLPTCESLQEGSIPCGR